jgi:hypothetical protein
VFPVRFELNTYYLEQRDDERQVKARLEAVRPCDVQKLMNSLKFKKACGIGGIPNEDHWFPSPI